MTAAWKGENEEIGRCQEDIVSLVKCSNNLTHSLNLSLTLSKSLPHTLFFPLLVMFQKKNISMKPDHHTQAPKILAASPHNTGSGERMGMCP